MKLNPSDLAFALVMTLLPLLLGAAALVVAVMMDRKQDGERARGSQRVAAIVLGCFGILLVLIGLGIGACWGFVMVG